MPRLIGIIQIALSLVIVCGLVTNCAAPSSTPAPAPSGYPADISGHVTITDKMIVRGELRDPGLSENEVFWFVNISVDNNIYENAVTNNPEDWRIVAGNEVYWIPEIMKVLYHPSIDSMEVFSGQSGQTVIIFKVPRSLALSNAQIRYQGQEPYSYGKLSGGDKVAVYDWDLKKAVAQAQDLRELYVVPDAYGKSSTKQLRTIASWSGTESRAINFSTDKSPWVVNGSYEVVSSLGHNFDYIVFTEDEYKAGDDALRQYLAHELLVPTRSRAGDNYLVKQSGKFVICVYASGVKWQLKVGVE